MALPRLVPLIGGSGGGGGGAVGSSFYDGGGGGGAVQLTARQSISVTGRIVVNGAGGGAGSAGGGAGGAILLESTAMTVSGRLIANGGGGGTAGPAQLLPNEDLQPSIGGSGCCNNGNPGGTGAAGDFGPGSGLGNNGNAGGGGSAGRLLLRSAQPAVLDGSLISPSAASGGFVIEAL